MEPPGEPLIQYGRPSEQPILAWSWVDEQLTMAGSYWLSIGGASPHPRPVWGVWAEDLVHLSVGSPTLAAATAPPGTAVSVHLGSDTNVVIVEGRTAGPTREPALIEAYNNKYDWDYVVDTYGPLTVVEPVKVMAWRSAGWAGQGGFQATGRWFIDRRSSGAARPTSA